jgi:hypothetical protein
VAISAAQQNWTETIKAGDACQDFSSPPSLFTAAVRRCDTRHRPPPMWRDAYYSDPSPVIHRNGSRCPVCSIRSTSVTSISTRNQVLAACSFDWWLMAGAGLFWEKRTADWLLVAVPSLLYLVKTSLKLSLALFLGFEHLEPFWRHWSDQSGHRSTHCRSS